jgi:hypothetical protein
VVQCIQSSWNHTINAWLQWAFYSWRWASKNYWCFSWRNWFEIDTCTPILKSKIINIFKFSNIACLRIVFHVDPT